MGTFLNNDDSIWFKHIEAHPDTVALLRQLKAGSRVRIEIEGVSGDWEKMKDHPDGTSTPGLRPVGQTKEFWKTMKPLRGKRFEFKIVDPRDSYLADVQKTLSEWSQKKTKRHFMICDHWSVVAVPFPFMERPAVKRRPALVVSTKDFNAANGHSILAMITAALLDRWPGDHDLLKPQDAGLKTASYVRWKVFTLPNEAIVKKIGDLSDEDREALMIKARTIFIRA